MFGLAKTFLEKDLQDRHIERWSWLLGHYGRSAPYARMPLVTPDRHFFPPTDAKGHARAQHIFNTLVRLAGLEGWPIDLIAHEARPQRVAPVMAVRHVGSRSAVTSGNGRFQVYYAPEDIADPLILVAVLAQGISTVMVRNLPEEPPGPLGQLEEVDDTASIFMGFGLFGANAAFNFSQSTEFDSQGWRMRRVGSLPEDEWAFGLALFCTLTGRDISVLKPWLKPMLFGRAKSARAIIERDKLASGLTVRKNAGS